MAEDATTPQTAADGSTAAESTAAESTAAESTAAESTAAESTAAPSLEDRIVEALKTVYDPEIPVNIYELGLIYDVDVGDGGHVDVKMTLTSPACPVAGTLPVEVEDKVKGVSGVASADVDVVWDPVWNPSMMSESAKLELGMMDF